MSVGPVALSSSDAAVISRQVRIRDDDCAPSDERELERFLRLDEVAEWVKGGGWRRVALQLPDGYLKHARLLCSRLSRSVPGVKPFVLADTSYGSCCVDVVTARHYGADCLVHYGDACYSGAPPTDMPVYHVPPRLKLPTGQGDDEDPVDGLAERLRAWSENGEDRNTPAVVVVLWQLRYDEWKVPVRDAVQSAWPDAFVEMAEPIDPAAGDADAHDPSTILLGRRRPTHLPIDVTLFIGSTSGSNSDPLMPLWLMAHGCQVKHALVFEPVLRVLRPAHRAGDVTRMLRKRLYLVERLRDARRLGVVCGAVSLAKSTHTTSVDRLRLLCARAGKSVHVFSVGKLNVEKLANFDADVDAFVLVSCPFGVLLDDRATKEHSQPICTPFEAEVALGGLRWSADAPWLAELSALPSEGEGQRMDQDEPDVSLIDNRLRPARQDISGGDASRTWTGLKEEHACAPGKVLPGKSGTAAAYDQESR